LVSVLECKDLPLKLLHLEEKFVVVMVAVEVMAVVHVQLSISKYQMK
jgi:hypothetical protein